jgi:hypothetical protein
LKKACFILSVYLISRIYSVRMTHPAKGESKRDTGCGVGGLLFYLADRHNTLERGTV